MKKLFAVLIALQLMIFPVPRAHASGLAGMANQLRGMAIGGIAATVLTTCPLGSMAASIKVFMAAGIVYLLGEMAAGKGQKDSIEGENDKVNSTTKGQGGETQLATLEAQLKDREEKKKVADKRAMFTAASMALMTAAAVVAATEIVPETTIGVPPPAGCVVPTAMASAKLKAAAIGGAFAFLGNGGITGALITGVGIYALGLSSMVSLLNTAKTRVMAFGALAAFTALALMDAKKESGKLSKEIEDLKKVIAQLKKETGDPGDVFEDTTGGATAGVTSGAEGGSTSGTLAGNSGGVTGGGVTQLPTGNIVTTRSCISGNAEISSNCANPLRVPALKTTDFNGGPEIQQVTSNGVELANDLAMGNAGGKADLAAASLASSAAKMNDQLKSQVAKSNAFLKTKGLKGIDLDKDVADTIKSMNSAIQSESGKSSQSLASLGIGDAGLDPNAATKAAQDINVASTNKEIVVPTSDGKLADAVAPIETPSPISSEANKVTEQSAKDALGNNLGDYETNDEDISANKETSLWKQVSNRYLLKYERFFERKKVPAQ